MLHLLSHLFGACGESHVSIYWLFVNNENNSYIVVFNYIKRLFQ